MTDFYRPRFDDIFRRLPGEFYTALPPEGVAHNPQLVAFHPMAARRLGWPEAVAAHPDFPAYFSGNKILPGSNPWAMVYSGHQFGVWAGQLGDGRAILLGQLRDASGDWCEVQLKGSGLTPYSRHGDGRAVLRSCVREYLASIAMQGLGIATTDALCIVKTNAPVQRETAEPGAVLTRLSRGHIRFGHFEHWFYAGRPDYVKILADYVIAAYDPGLSYADWFALVMQRTARMIASWQAVGFAHGVMNTDNMSILGETIDYGPFGFVEAYDPGFICNHSDTTGRYAFDKQPDIALWNLYALAYALQPVLPFAAAKEILADFATSLSAEYARRMTNKFGLREPDAAAQDLCNGFLSLLAAQRVDYTHAFAALAAVDGETDGGFLKIFAVNGPAQAWLHQYRTHPDFADPNRVARQAAVNPKYILRNWVAEVIIRAAVDDDDYAPIKTWQEILANPFADYPGMAGFAQPAPAQFRDLCVSCSS